MKKIINISAGIDVSKASLDVAIINNGEVTGKVFENSEKGIRSLATWLKTHGADADTPVVIESTGSLHWLTCLILTESGFTINLINPLITKKYQKATIRDSKSDRIDALRLADIGRLESDLPVFLDTREQLTQKRYQALLDKLQKTKQQLSRSYNDAINAMQVIGVEMELDCIEICIKQLDQAIEVLKNMITENASPLAKELSKIRGVSLFQAEVLCTAVQGKKFQKREQLIAFFGLDVKQRQSGKWTGRQKLSKRGNPFYRQILFQLGWSLQRNNPDYHEYYIGLYKEKDKHYYTAILATSRKFLRYFFKVLNEKSIDLIL